MNTSAHSEAAKEVERLRGTAVVLTTYDVLQREVHFSPNEERLSSLRSEKRYQVPTSPLLSLRCVCDKSGSEDFEGLLVQELPVMCDWRQSALPHACWSCLLQGVPDDGQQLLGGVWQLEADARVWPQSAAS